MGCQGYQFRQEDGFGHKNAKNAEDYGKNYERKVSHSRREGLDPKLTHAGVMASTRSCEVNVTYHISGHHKDDP
jgi:hypothetical protein